MAEAGGGGGGRKVEVILLAEQHGSYMCSMKNIDILGKYISNTLKRLKNKDAVIRSTLLFSEGRGINECYTALQFPDERIMIEHGAEQTKLEQIDKFSLLLELLDISALGEDLGADPSGKKLNALWFVNRAQNDGFNQLLETIPNGKRLYTELVMSSMMHRAEEYNTKLTAFCNLILEHFLSDGGDEHLREIITRIHDAPLAVRNPVLKGVYVELRNARDANIISRISARVDAEPHVQTVFLIIGAAHYPNMVRLIEASPNLRLSPLSNATYRGGKSRRRRRRRRQTRRRRTASGSSN